jgi:hypothetical protein
VNEDAMIAAAKRLGAGPADRLDVEAIARTVMQRLREQPAHRFAWIHVQWVRIAAALVIGLGGGFAMHEMWPVKETGGHAAHFVADDLSGLSTDQLRDVLDRFDELVGATGTALPEGSGDLRELDEQQLRRVLRALEG